ncbi:MAG: hypothetical protein IJ491_04700 [Clostridia bacterium]|nr:hypothetical protein [Clostridia bacterium]
MKKILACILTFTVCLCFFSFGTQAADGQKITVDYSTSEENLEGAVFHIYRLGTVSGTKVIPNDTFSSYRVNFDISDSEKMTSLALTISAYILRDDIVPVYTDTTDKNGIVNFDGVAFEKGVYIIMADKHRQNECTYFCEPLIVVLPYGEEDNLIIKPKYEAVPDDTETISVSYKVLKSWVEVEGTEKAVEIEVELLRDGEVYDTVTLNESNNWRYQWDGLSVFYHWTVTEKYVLGGYVVSLSQYDKTLLLTNSGIGPGEEETTTAPDETTEQDSTDSPEQTTASQSTTTSQAVTSTTQVTTTETTEPDDEPELPVTGTLRWPVPYLALIGVFLFIVGYAKYRKSELRDE